MSMSERRARRRERRAEQRAQDHWLAPRTAFVLSGGGVLGAVQVGQLRALLEQGVTPDVCIGTSVGALNAAMIASEPTLDAVERIGELWRSLKTEDVFPGSRVARVWNIVARGDHIHSNDGIRRLIEQVPARTFEAMQIPLHVCATNLASGKETWFTQGPLTRAILASTALPGVFPPVSIDGALYVDGGVVNNVPISRAVELGARRIYVFTCSVPQTTMRPITRPIDVLIQSFSHARSVRIGLDLERWSDQAEIIMLPVFDAGFIRYNDPSHSARLMERSYDLTRAFLAQPDTAQA